MADGKVVIETDLDSKGVEQGLSKMQSLVGKGFGAAAKSVAVVSTALTAAGGYAIKTGIDFESSFAGIKKTVEATPEQFEKLRTSILDMSKEIPQSASSLAEIGEAAGQLGIKTENIEGFIETMANLGVATNMSSEQAATSLARLANITGMPQTQFDRLGSTIVALGNNLATTESEITEMGLRLAGAGSQVGMSEAQIMSFSAALSSVGIEAEAGGSAFSKVMIDMQLAAEKGGDSLNDFANVAGMSASDFQKAFKEDAAGAMTAFIQGLATCDERGVSAIKTLDDMGISEVRMRDALLRAAGASDVFTEALEIGTQAWEENTALTNEAAQRYETLESKLQLMKNSADILAIAFKDSIDTQLRSAVEAGTGYIDDLAAAFEDGGLESAVSKAGDIFAELAVKAAQQAPSMINSAVALIQAFVSGLVRNKAKLYTAAVQIAKTFAQGLIKLLPSQMQKPGRDAINALAKSLQSGGLKSAVSTVCTTLGNIAKVVGNIASAVLPPFMSALDFAAKHIDLLAAAAGAGAAAFGAYKVLQTISSMMAAYQAVLATLTAMEQANALQLFASTGALTLKQFAVGVLTGKITLATAAQAAWNAVMNANPIGIIVTALAALAAGVAAYRLTQEEVLTTEELRMQQIEEHNQKLHEEVEALRESRAARQEAVAGIEAEAGYYQSLWDEMQTIVDQNGNIKAGHEDRAATIVALLEKELGVTIDVVDGQIQEYDKLKSSIDSVIEKRRQEAILDAYYDDYKEAIKNVVDAENDVIQKLQQKKQAQQELADAQTYLTGLQTGTIQAEGDFTEACYAAEQAIGDKKIALENAKTAYSDAQEKMNAYTTDVANYEAAMGAVESGSQTASLEVLKLSRDFQSASNSTKDALKQQAETAQTEYDAILQAVSDGSMKITDTSVANAQAMCYLTKAEYGKLSGMSQEEISKWIEIANQAIGGSNTPEVAQQEAQETVDAIVDTQQQGQGPVTEAAAAVQDSVNIGTESVDTATPATNKAQEAIDGEVNALNAGKSSVTEASASAAEGVNEGTASVDTIAPASEVGTETIQALIDSINSLNDTAKGAAEQLMQAVSGTLQNGSKENSAAGAASANSYITGFNSKKGSASNAGKGLLNSIRSGSVGNISAVGASVGGTYVTGITSKSGSATSAGTTLANAAKSGVSGINITQQGITHAMQFITGINSKMSSATSAGKALANASKTGIQSVTANSAGESFANQFVVGVYSGTGSAVTAGAALANNAYAGANSVSAYGVGVNFGAGFVNGINSQVAAARAAGAALAAAAAAASAKRLDEHSPSKVMYKIGVYGGEGFANGITSQIKAVTKSAVSLADAAFKTIKAATAKNNYKSAGESAIKAYESGMNKAIKSAKSSAQKSINSAVSSLKKEMKKQNEKDAVAERAKAYATKSGKDLEKAIEKINSDLQKKNAKVDSDCEKAGKSWMDSISKGFDAQSKAAIKKATTAIDKLAEETQKKYDEIIKAREAFQGKLGSYGGLYSTSDGRTDLTKTTKVLEQYDKDLKALKKKGVSADLLSDISQMNIDEAAQFAAELAKMSDKELKAYNDAYVKQQKVAKQISKDFYQNQIDDLQKDFTNKVNKQLSTLKTSLQKIGEDAVAGLVKGLNSKSLKGDLKKFTDSIVNQIKKNLKINSPSKVLDEDIGQMIPAGVGQGVDKNTKTAEKSVSRLADAVIKEAEKIEDKLPQPKIDFSGIDVASIVSRMRAGVQMETAKLSQELSATVNYKISGIAKVQAEAAAQERSRLADEIVDAFARSDVGIAVDRRQFGRLIREV